MQSDRRRAIDRVLEDAMRRRSTGEGLPDDAIIRAHADLMPDLAEQLRKLSLIEDSVRRARSSGAVHARITRTPQQEVPFADTIEGYTIINEIHRGGQGTVFLAVQDATGVM